MFKHAHSRFRILSVLAPGSHTPPKQATSHATTTHRGWALAALLGAAPLAVAPAHASAAEGGSCTQAQVRPQPDAAYLSGEVLVQLTDEAGSDAAQALARTLGARLVSSGRVSGVHRLALPDAATQAGLEDALRWLRRQPQVRSASRNGSLSADSCGAVDARFVDAQWHLERLGVDQICQNPPPGLSGVRVAILDSGLTRVADLQSATIVAPYNAFDPDKPPTDFNGHGTHLASTIAGDGDAMGVAPGLQLMPVSVLDSANQGSEAALLEGLWWAIKNGADVINLSLSFGHGYFPSDMLQEALGAAAAQGIIVVSSAGNSGSVGVTWPAAFPQVIAVGATRPTASKRGPRDHAQALVTSPNPWISAVVERFGPEGDTLAEYSNIGSSIDLVAPGGSLETDFNGDDLPDGIIAQGLSHDDPSLGAYWVIAGTSQATAQVSAAAAWLLGMGVPSDEVRAHLAHTARTLDGDPTFDAAFGSGAVDLRAATEAASRGPSPSAPRYYVNTTPVLETDPATELVRAVVRVEVMDSQGHSQPGISVRGTFYGSTVEHEARGITEAQGDTSVTWIASGWFEQPPEGALVGFQVNALVLAGERMPAHPDAYYSMSPAFAETLAQLMVTMPEDTVILHEISWKVPEVVALFPGVDFERCVVSKAMGAGQYAGPVSMVMDMTYLQRVLGEAKQQPLELVWPGALGSGWGPITGVSGNVAEALSNTGTHSTFVVLPMDPALATTDTTRFYPVLNSPAHRFEASNQQLGNTLPKEPLISGYPDGTWPEGFASVSLGESFQKSLPGDAFSASALGATFSASAVGDGFASSSMGMAFASSSLGDAFAASSLGYSLNVEQVVGGVNNDFGAGGAELDAEGAPLATPEPELEPTPEPGQATPAPRPTPQP